MKRIGYQDGLSNEDDLDEFLKNFKERKAIMIENGESQEPQDKAIKDNAFNDAAKKVVNVIEKEAPGIVPKEVKDKMQIYKKDEPEEKLSDRVVATIDSNNTIALNGPGSDPNLPNPLQNLHNLYKDSYGKILASQAVNFYNNVVQPRAYQPPAPQHYPSQYPPSYPPVQVGQPMIPKYPPMSVPPPGQYYPHPMPVHPPPYGYPMYPPGYPYVAAPQGYPYGQPPPVHFGIQKPPEGAKPPNNA